MNPYIKKRFGFILHGNKLWLSELTSIIVVCAIFFILCSITFVILRNEIRTHNSNKVITTLRTENVILQKKLEHLRNVDQIARTLCSFVGKRISTATIYRLSELVYTNSSQFGYDPILLLSVIHVESYFRPEALGKYKSGTLSGAMGLMQLKFETAKQVAQQLQMGPLTREDLLNPETNIVLGVAYLTQLVKQFKSFKLGLLAYNQGPGTITANLNNKTQLSVQYYKKVIKSYYKLKEYSSSSDSLPNASSCF